MCILNFDNVKFYNDYKILFFSFLSHATSIVVILGQRTIWYRPAQKEQKYPPPPDFIDYRDLVYCVLCAWPTPYPSHRSVEKMSFMAHKVRLHIELDDDMWKFSSTKYWINFLLICNSAYFIKIISKVTSIKFLKKPNSTW